MWNLPDGVDWLWTQLAFMWQSNRNRMWILYRCVVHVDISITRSPIECKPSKYDIPQMQQMYDVFHCASWCKSMRNRKVRTQKRFPVHHRPHHKLKLSAKFAAFHIHRRNCSCRTFARGKPMTFRANTVMNHFNRCYSVCNIWRMHIPTEPFIDAENAQGTSEWLC